MPAIQLPAIQLHIGKGGGAHSLMSSTFVVIALVPPPLLRPHQAHVGHVCSHDARCLPFCWLFPQKYPRDVWHGGAGRPGVFPPSTIATNPAVALLNTTVILINKHLHLCILLCEPGRVLRQAARLKTRAPALRARPLFYHFRLNGDRHF